MIISFKLIGDFSKVQQGCELLAKRLGIRFSPDGIPLCVVPDADHLSVQREESGYCISYSDTTEFFRGLAFLCDAVKKERDISICEKKRFKTCGVMYDVSVGAVYKVETACDMIEQMALMGLNMMMLYSEDIYEMKKYPEFGYLRGAYTSHEIKEIDAYARIFGIELVPCIETLGHLQPALRWPSLGKLADNSEVLMVGEDETYEFIEEMFKTCAENFTSRNIHIGLDETYGLGRGKYLTKNGFRELGDIFFEHLARVCEIAKKYGFKPMMWNDMIFKLDGTQSFLIEDTEKLNVPEKHYSRYPENINLVYYNYGGAYGLNNQKVTRALLEQHKKFNRRTVFGGAIWTWGQLSAGLGKTYISTKVQLELCEEYGIDTVFACVWDTLQHQTNLYTAIPGMQIWAELQYHPDADMEFIWDRFELCTGYNKDEWKLLYCDEFSDEDMQKYCNPAAYCVNPSFQHLYNDILTGMLDKTLSGYDFKSHYGKFLAAIKKVDGGKMNALFRRYESLYEILYVKCDIGIRLREAYKKGDKKAILDIQNELESLPELYRQYHDCVENDWYALNKPFGYSGLDMHLGMIEARIKTAINVVRKYLDGTYDILPELECDIEYYLGSDKPLTEVGAPTGFMSTAILNGNF